MSRTTRIVVGIIIAVIVVGVLAFAYLWVSGGSGEPSEPISAPTLAISTREATAAPIIEPTDEVSAAVTAEATDTAEAATIAGDLVVFNIDVEQSEVSFTLTEELRGQPKTVVGTTREVAGQIAVDFGDPQASQVGEIRINARTLTTPEEMRNRTIRGQILQSAQDRYEFISFQPTEISGLPSTITMGEPIEFQLTGDLTIREITQSVTFDVTATPVSETQLEGSAEVTIQRADFELTIPSVPQVANVSEDVQLKIDFVATAAE